MIIYVHINMVEEGCLVFIMLMGPWFDDVILTNWSWVEKFFFFFSSRSNYETDANGSQTFLPVTKLKHSFVEKLIEAQF